MADIFDSPVRNGGQGAVVCVARIQCRRASELTQLQLVPPVPGRTEEREERERGGGGGGKERERGKRGERWEGEGN